MTSLKLLLAVLSVTPTVTFAHDIVVQQNGRANVYGSVQAGPQPGTLTVEQSGVVNIVGIVQAVPNGGAVVVQNGQRNAALVSQFTSALYRLLP